ncbi:class I adenylate-forming enzyme family protein [Kitasatospora sp. NPDC056327]|uniref:class I adenylate-forming enzyme family protein n=1 Tax=Kitasatospora sp. NPDC056327 TaxID=3345785 RepID=UPI0035DE147B
MTDVFRTALLNAVAAGGEAVAVIDDHAAVRYRTLERWSADLARLLPGPHQDGSPAPRCALLLPNSAAWLAAYLAALRAGLLVAPLNIALTDTEVTRVLVHSHIDVLLCPPERAADLHRLTAERRLRTRVLPVASAPPHDAGGGGGSAVPGPWPHSRAGAACLLMHTSGTTGTPKAVVQTEQALALTTAYWSSRHRRPHDTVALVLPLAHTYGHLAATATLLAGGCTVLSGRPFDADHWAHLVRRHRVSVIEGPPAVYIRLLANGTDLPGLRECLTGGQQPPPGLPDAWRTRYGVALREAWGMTELSGPGLDASLGACPGSAGLPVPGLEVQVTNPSDGLVANEGEVGELRVRGREVTPGRDEDGRTEPLTDALGWLHTGDLARADAHGCVTIVGRSKDVILTNGYTVHPAEIEQALFRHPDVQDAAAIGLPDPQRGEAVHAVLVVRPGARTTPEEVLHHCRQYLARYKIPRTLHFARALPLSPTGKVDRTALRAGLPTP